MQPACPRGMTKMSYVPMEREEELLKIIRLIHIYSEPFAPSTLRAIHLDSNAMELIEEALTTGELEALIKKYPELDIPPLTNTSAPMTWEDFKAADKSLEALAEEFRCNADIKTPSR